MTGAAFKTAILTHVNRSGDTVLTAVIPTLCDLAVKELQKHGFWFQLTSTTVSTAAATKYAALPTGFVREVLNGFRTVGGTALDKRTWAEVDYWQRSSAGTGEPDYFAIADKFYFYPIPDAIYALPLQYYTALAFPGDSASNAWTDDVWDLTFYSVLELVWDYLGNQEEKAKAMAHKGKLLAQARALSGKHVSTGRVTYRDW